MTRYKELPVGEFLSSLQEMMPSISKFLFQVLDQFSEISVLLDNTCIDISMSLETKKHFEEQNKT